ncbi:hypothetical protein [Methanosarcina barkeri]|uniref:Glyoxalase family protein n=1 Tax=Methanosarcina barkeri CM1 TaxID=796385 RepID=A0A0G3CF18_METBA|nr:hypothetical protein [Methanosarcina barkeri]AKJ37667.1 hypothetical protein MCM1_0569 [Methanosarcina barkeri CM1]
MTIYRSITKIGFCDIMKILQTLSRLYINDLNSALEFYEELLGSPAAMRFEILKIGL